MAVFKVALLSEIWVWKACWMPPSLLLPYLASSFVTASLCCKLWLCLRTLSFLKHVHGVSLHTIDLLYLFPVLCLMQYWPSIPVTAPMLFFSGKSQENSFSHLDWYPTLCLVVPVLPTFLFLALFGQNSFFFEWNSFLFVQPKNKFFTIAPWVHGFFVWALHDCTAIY